MREAFVHHVAGLYHVPGTLPRAGEMDVNISGLSPRRSSQAGWRRDHSKGGETLWLKGVLLQRPASTLTGASHSAFRTVREGVLGEVTSGYRGMHLDIERDEWAVCSDVQQPGEKRECGPWGPVETSDGWNVGCVCVCWGGSWEGGKLTTEAGASQ